MTAAAGFVGAAEGDQETDRGPGSAFYIGIEGAGLVVIFQGLFVVSGVVAEGGRLEESPRVRW
ncbi:hypothetical protein [Nonomuraea sp. GTA35]|uniref:hypothetical protein n=1 Tax=Nonomuraea sp. GTA35 TaxID=1676746 RepID=UPI0035BF8A62